MSPIARDLRTALRAFAALPRVLVAVDVDGTLAPFVTDPLQARALPGGLEALREAAGLPGVMTAVVSDPPRTGCTGRRRRDRVRGRALRPPGRSNPHRATPPGLP